MFHVMAVLCLASCASTPEPEPFHATDVTIETIHFLGFPLSGPRGGMALSTSADEALSLSVHLFALAVIPETLLESVGAHARLIMSTLEDFPLLAAPWLTSGSRAGPLSDANAFMETLTSGRYGECVPMVSLRAALPSGVTAVFMGRDPVPGMRGGFSQPFERTVAVYCYRPIGKDPFQFAIALEDLVYVAQEEDEPGLMEEETQYTPPEPDLVREILVGGQDVPSGVRAVAIIVPSPFDEAPAGALAFVFEFFPAPEAQAPEREAHEAAFKRCIADLSTSGSATEGYSEIIVPGRSGWEGYSATLRALASPDEQRMALAFAAREVYALLMEDIAMSMRDDQVAKLASSVVESADKYRLKEDEKIAWMLESMALKHYLDALNRLETTPELEGIVAMHIGEPSRRIASLEEILARARDMKTFGTLVYYENLRFLDDPSPSARVNAYDWLVARDRAPEGYDPLGPFDERRAALVKALAELDEGERL